MSRTEDFLSKAQEKEVIDAIINAEKNTSGEIRVHIEEFCEEDVLVHAAKVFDILNMDKTEERNGVLFYVSMKPKKFAIIGDSGINEKVSSDFWDSTKDIVLYHFKQAKYKEGLIFGIESAGEKLKEFFPYQKDDKNELSNEISRG
jgi:uncharacterized membrane protein